MIGNWLTDQGLLLGPAVALLIFLLVFAAVLVWIFRPGSTEAYEKEARLPFDDDALASATKEIFRMREDEDGSR